MTTVTSRPPGLRGDAARTFTATDNLLYPLTIDVSGFSGATADTANFGSGILLFEDVNLPDTRPNIVWSMGYNMAAGGGRRVLTEPTIGVVFESYYVQGGVDALELHLTSTDLSGTEHRLWSAFAPRDGSTGSVISQQTDTYTTRNYAGTPIMNVNNLTQETDYVGPMVIRFNDNAVPTHQQRNAADSAFLNLPFFGSDDTMRVSAATRFAGATPAAGVYPGSFIVIQPTATANNDIFLDINVQTLASGDAFGFDIRGTVTAGKLSTVLYNAGTAGTSRAVMEVWTSGASGGDPYIAFDVLGVTTYGFGIDNSDSDKLKISRAATLGSSDVMTWDAANNVFLANTTSVPGTPTGGGHIYVESGALKYKGSGGTITTLGAA